MEWISVKDKLPEWGQRVLLFDGEIKTGFFYKWRRKTGWLCELDCWADGYDFEADETVPTHWAHLPEPPSNLTKYAADS